MITNNNITFGAKINICNADNLLSAKELKKLTKAGEKIGKNTDSIDIYIGNSKNDMFISTYTTNFKSKENPTNRLILINFRNFSCDNSVTVNYVT